MGTRGEHLLLTEEVNPAVNGARIDPTRGPSLLRSNAGDAIYHSLQARLERVFSDGLMFRFAYTYSKVIDDVTSEGFATTGGTSRQSQPFDRRADRSIASFDVPHRARRSSVYTTPAFSCGRSSAGLR